MPIRVAVDALGGDRGPEEIVAGARDAATAEIEPIIFGPAGLDPLGLAHVVTDGMIEMDDKPAEAVRAKPDASLVRAARAVGDGEADAVVSAGNTGAMLAAGLLHIRRLPGVLRPGIAVMIPSRAAITVLIDAGANADARPEHLAQFAHMGSLFSHDVLDVATPTVGLLSIGEEREKGNQLTLEAHDAIASCGVRFVGNVEGRALSRRWSRCRRLRWIHRQRCAEDPRGDNSQPPRCAPRRDLRNGSGKARRFPDPPGRSPTSRTARSGYLRRRLPPRPPRAGCHRARFQLEAGDHQRESAPPRSGSTTASWGRSRSASRRRASR